MNRMAMMLVLVLFSGFLHAGTSDKYSFAVLPPSPIAGESFSINVSVSEGSCHVLLPIFPVSPQGSNVIRFEVVVGDTCTPNLPAQERTYSIGPLDVGSYTFRYAFCGSTVFGYNCSTIRESAVTVVPGAVSPRAHTVPIWSLAGMGTAIVLIALVAMLHVGAHTGEYR